MANNPKAKDNLKPFKKGKSGNPKGKKKGCKDLKTRAIEMLAAISEDGEYSTPICDAIIKVLENEEGIAKPSEVIKSAEFLRDTIDGKPTQKIEQTTNDITPPTKIRLVGPKEDD
jgi:hypothetical protein